jgi:hypothetical protein
MLTRAVATTLLVFAVGRAAAQTACASAPAIVVGSEWERYLRVAQSVGAVSLEPWTARSFGPRQWAKLQPSDTTLPWSRGQFAAPRAGCRQRFAFVQVPARVQLLYNSGFPLGGNDGAIWAGRGMTTAVEAGGSVTRGALTVMIAPLVVASQNAAFQLRPNGLAGARAFGDWRLPNSIDLPQRFGDRTYAYVDPGQSEVRLDVAGAAIGVSTTNQFWGPAGDHPLILGNNAAGIPRLFLGTSQALRLWRLGRVHGQLFWGRAGQSPYSPLDTSATDRLVSGMVAVFQPAAFPGLEIGASRFFHVLQDRWTLNATELLRPFGTLLKLDFADQSAAIARGDNQLASVFFRFVAPASGVDFYGEFGREDHSNTLREFWQLIDHDAGYLLGLRKSWRQGARLWSARAEALNTHVTHIALSSQQTPWYVHGVVRTGHTHRGQVLGSIGAYGGGATVLGLDRYDDRGRLSVAWERVQVAETSETHVPADAHATDVVNAWRITVLRARRRADIEAGIAVVNEINRQQMGDAFAAQAQLSVYWSGRR